MNVEQLDGFFAALIAGPEIVMPSEYYGRDVGRLRVRQPRRSQRHLGTDDAALERHRRDAVQGRIYVPLLLEDENCVAHGNDWAHGFMRGTLMRHDGWTELTDDEEQDGRCLIPMMMLHHEHDEDPEMRPEPISPEQRENIKDHMAAGLVQAYRYFREHRQVNASAHKREPRRNAPKVGQVRLLRVKRKRKTAVGLRPRVHSNVHNLYTQATFPATIHFPKIRGKFIRLHANP